VEQRGTIVWSCEEERVKEGQHEQHEQHTAASGQCARL
jgi:hypothetical protein